jgi:RES domain-containing protein
VVYASESIALAALELLVHVDPPEAPDDLVVIPADIPAGLATTQLTTRTLPTGWRSTAGLAALQDLGRSWLRGGKTAVLSVPSVVVPEERNFILNPSHPDFARIKRGVPKAFALDPRLYR